MKFHPYSEIFPLIEGAEFDALVDDIKTHGLREAIVLYEGKVLDGRNRFLACQKAKVRPQYRKYSGKESDALAFVWSSNAQRRHLTASQLAMAAAKRATLQKGTNQHAQICAPSQEDAAEDAGVSRRSVQHARKVLEEGSKALQHAVESGDLSVSRAAAVVALPKSEQLAAATQKPERSEPDVPDFSVQYEFDENDDAIIEQKEREYQEAIEKVMGSDDHLATANKEIKRLAGLVAVLTKARDQFMNSHGEAVRFIKRLQRENDRLRKKYEPRPRAAVNGAGAHA